MTSAQDVTVTDLSTAERLSEALAEVFRTAEVGDVLTDDVFLDGNPPLWRFQLQGIDAFAAWYKSYAPNGIDEVTVVRTVPTASGFVTELTERNREDDGKEITGREIMLCTVRDGRISELTVYCSGDWDEELRARHAAEAPMLARETDPSFPGGVVVIQRVRFDLANLHVTEAGVGQHRRGQLPAPHRAEPGAVESQRHTHAVHPRWWSESATAARGRRLRPVTGLEVRRPLPARR